MKRFRYPPKALTGDYIRAGVGMAVGYGVLLFVPASPAIIAIFGGVAGLFSYFGYRTLERQKTEIAVTDVGLNRIGFGCSVLAWSDLERLKLRYFGTKRQGQSGGGFMQLTLKGGGTSLTCDSSLEGFGYVAWCAAKAAREQGVPIDSTSIGNFLAIGIDAESETRAPDLGV